jgi:succinoglycan biosynthesis protein ExoA
MAQVSIIVPCLNEQATIRLMLEAVYCQSFPRHEMEVIIADGMSTDETLHEIDRFKDEFPGLTVRVVTNDQRNIPSGLNKAIQVSNGEYLIRLDGHSEPEPEYIAKCVQDLIDRKGDNVGGRWEIKPRNNSWQARSISIAASHPLGVGDARYRIGGKAQPVETVPFGAFRRELINKIGLFDETLLSNEDYEFNARIRKAGGTVWFDPEICSTYFAASNFSQLAKQYFRYGFWKARMLRLHPDTLRWRQALPPAFILSLVLALIVGIVCNPLFLILMLELACYTLFMLIVSVQTLIKQRNISVSFGVPSAIATMHFSWGCGFIWSWLKRR